MFQVESKGRKKLKSPFEGLQAGRVPSSWEQGPPGLPLTGSLSLTFQSLPM